MPLQKCNTIALELNPENWQHDMMYEDAAQTQISNYFKNSTNDYINEKFF